MQLFTRPLMGLLMSLLIRLLMQLLIRLLMGLPRSQALEDAMIFSWLLSLLHRRRRRPLVARGGLVSSTPFLVLSGSLGLSGWLSRSLSVSLKQQALWGLSGASLGVSGPLRALSGGLWGPSGASWSLRGLLTRAVACRSQANLRARCGRCSRKQNMKWLV